MFCVRCICCILLMSIRLKLVLMCEVLERNVNVTVSAEPTESVIPKRLCNVQCIVEKQDMKLKAG